MLGFGGVTSGWGLGFGVLFPGFSLGGVSGCSGAGGGAYSAFECFVGASYFQSSGTIPPFLPGLYGGILFTKTFSTFSDTRVLSVAKNPSFLSTDFITWILQVDLGTVPSAKISVFTTPLGSFEQYGPGNFFDIVHTGQVVIPSGLGKGIGL